MIIECDRTETGGQDTESKGINSALDDRSDYELVTAFIQHREEDAFRTIVVRYGSLVMGVCRGVLRNQHDAEDACQATFLVLARNARRIRRKTSLASWLYGVAYRTCLKARVRNQKQQVGQFLDIAMIEDHRLDALTDCHATRVLHEELNQLPEKYRATLVLCCLEGKSREEVAEQLGCSPGAIKGRLERGRQLLRRRLLTRGATMAVLVGFVVDSTIARAAISVPFVTSTVGAAMAFSSGNAVGSGISSEVLSLAEGSLAMSSVVSTRLVFASVLAVALLGVVCGLVLTQRAIAQTPVNHLETTQEAAQPTDAESTAQFTLADGTGSAGPTQANKSASHKEPTPADFVLKEFGEATAELDVARLSKLYLKPDKTDKGRQRGLHLQEAKKDWVRAKKERGGAKMKVDFQNTMLIIRTDMKMEGAERPMRLELEIINTADGWKVVSMDTLQNEVESEN